MADTHLLLLVLMEGIAYMLASTFTRNLFLTSRPPNNTVPVLSIGQTQMQTEAALPQQPEHHDFTGLRLADATWRPLARST